jgi:hypothetical protein
MFGGAESFVPFGTSPSRWDACEGFAKPGARPALSVRTYLSWQMSSTFMSV